MSGIARRTIFVDDSAGALKFWDWAQVNTAVGTMAEPRVFGMQRPFDGVAVAASKLEPTDDIYRVDEIRRASIGKEKFLLCDDTTIAIHGGQLWPRVGY